MTSVVVRSDEFINFRPNHFAKPSCDDKLGGNPTFFILKFVEIKIYLYFCVVKNLLERQ